MTDCLKRLVRLCRKCKLASAGVTVTVCLVRAPAAFSGDTEQVLWSTTWTTSRRRVEQFRMPLHHPSSSLERWAHVIWSPQSAVCPVSLTCPESWFPSHIPSLLPSWNVGVLSQPCGWPLLPSPPPASVPRSQLTKFLYNVPFLPPPSLSKGRLSQSSTWLYLLLSFKADAPLLLPRPFLPPECKVHFGSPEPHSLH